MSDVTFISEQARRAAIEECARLVEQRGLRLNAHAVDVRLTAKAIRELGDGGTTF